MTDTDSARIAPPSLPRRQWELISAGTVLFVVASTMDLTLMLLVTIGITLERLMPNPLPLPRGIGAFIILTGLSMIARAMRLV